MWFSVKSKPAIGDEAYVDRKGDIHVRKDKVRYFISMRPANEQELLELAGSVIGRM